MNEVREVKRTYSSKKKLFLWSVILIALLIVIQVNHADENNAPDENKISGKSWMTQGPWGEPNGAWSEFGLGNKDGESSSFFDFSTNYFDGEGKPLRTTLRTGHFFIDGNRLTCVFDDGEIKQFIYTQTNGEESLIDGNGQIYVWDNPSKREY